MVSFITHNLGLFSRKEVWFYNDQKIENSGYTVFVASKHKPSEKTTSLNIQTTACIALSKTPEALFDSIHSGTRYDIKMGEKLNLNFKYYFNPNNDTCKHLLHDFLLFAQQKGVKPIDKKWLFAIRKSQRICITKICDEKIEISTHVYLFNDENVILTHSFHNIYFTNQTIRGYANKLLHWKDILLFREKGFLMYNFGGINTDLKGISDFKTRFGGEITETYSYIKTNFIIGFFVTAYKLIFIK